MADIVNPQITDAVTQSNVKVLAEAPAMAMGAVYQSMAHSLGLMFENAVSAQQQQNMMAQAAANQGVMQIYSLDTAAAALAASKIGQSDVPDNLMSLLAALRAFSGDDQAQAVEAALAAVKTFKPAAAKPATTKPGA